MDGKKKPFNPDKNKDIDRQYLTSAGTESFTSSKLRRLSTPGRLDIDSSTDSRPQTAFVVTRSDEVISKGRQRRLLEEASKFLEKETSFEERKRAAKRDVPMEILRKWQEELQQDFKREDQHRVALYRHDRKNRGLPEKGVVPPTDRTDQVRKNQRKLRKQYAQGKKHSVTRKVESAGPTSPTNKNQISSAPYFKKEPFKTVTVPRDFKEVVRAADPVSPVKSYEAFLKRHPNVAPKILTDKFSASSFIPSPSTLKLSKEMKASIQRKIHNQADRDVWDGFWGDPVCSQLAKHYDANLFVESESLGAYEPDTAPMLITKINTAVERAHDSHVEKRFAYVNEAHQAACIIQRMVRARKRQLLVAATSLARIYRGFEVRRGHLERVTTRESAAVMIQALYRGNKGRVRANFIRKTSWDMVALTGQRVIRGFLGRLRFKRFWARRDFLCAQRIQKRVRGMIGRRLAREWRAIVHDRSSRKIQKMVRWYHFRKGYQSSVAAYNLFALNHQRLWRGTRGRIIANRRRKRHFAAIEIQRVCARGGLGRKFAREKMKIFRVATTIIQTRWRGIGARARCPKIRQDRIDAERARRLLEERSVEIKVQEYLDYMKTKKGKKDYKRMYKNVKKKRRKVAKKRVRMSKAEKHEHDIMEAFELFDTDGSGSIDRGEFRHVTHELGVDMSNREIDEAMDIMDEDKNGVADYDEFAKWFGNLHKHGVKAAAIRIKLKGKKFFRDLFGFSARTHTKQAMLAKVRKEQLVAFRVAHPPPFQCDECMKKFIFSYELERHLAMGKKNKCPGLYHPVKQILSH
jgi:hypothetical protein